MADKKWTLKDRLVTGLSKPGAPDPGYDREPVAHERVEMDQPAYPANFVSRLKGKPGNINAQSQMRKSKDYE